RGAAYTRLPFGCKFGIARLTPELPACLTPTAGYTVLHGGNYAKLLRVNAGPRLAMWASMRLTRGLLLAALIIGSAAGCGGADPNGPPLMNNGGKPDNPAGTGGNGSQQCSAPTVAPMDPSTLPPCGSAVCADSPTAHSLNAADGVCLSVCVPQVKQYESLLPQDTCAADERCAPCINPLTNMPSGACDIGKPTNCNDAGGGGSG